MTVKCFFLLIVVLHDSSRALFRVPRRNCKNWNPKSRRTSKLKPQISNRGRRYSISNIKQQLIICQQILKTWPINLFFCHVVYKLGAFVVYSLSFYLADLNWPRSNLPQLDICGKNNHPSNKTKQTVFGFQTIGV